MTITSQNCDPYVYDWTSVPGGTTFPNDSTATSTITTTTDFTVCYTNNVDDTCCTTITIVVGSLDPLVVNGTDEICIGDCLGGTVVTAGGGTGRRHRDPPPGAPPRLALSSPGVSGSASPRTHRARARPRLDPLSANPPRPPRSPRRRRDPGPLSRSLHGDQRRARAFSSGTRSQR